MAVQTPLLLLIYSPTVPYTISLNRYSSSKIWISKRILTQVYSARNISKSIPLGTAKVATGELCIDALI